MTGSSAFDVDQMAGCRALRGGPAEFFLQSKPRVKHDHPFAP
jgi:hypothetical protein